jgi:hypothetical protein
MDQADNSEYLPVIVALKGTFDVAQVAVSYDLRGDEDRVREQTIQIMKDEAERGHHWLMSYSEQRSSQVKDFKSFWISNMVAMKATPDAIREIAAQPEVDVIFLDEEQMFVSYFEGEPMRDAWGLKTIGSDDVNKKFKGKGVVVAVVDTGVNYTHDDLKGRVLMGKDCYNNDMDPMDDNGHGSHCAGTVAGTTFGVAPEATILAVKVLSGSGSGSWQSVADGVQYVADYEKDGKRVDVVSMSLGGRAPIQPVLRQAFDNAVKLGIRFAVAAGNSGPSAKTIGTTGDQKDVVSVGATDIKDGIASFSSRGPVVAYGDPYIKPDISAPGVNITSCWKGAANATKTISGTSMATPHVAGLMALMLEVNPGMKADEVKKVLESTSKDLGDKGLDTSFGWGRIDAKKATKTTEMLSGRMEIEKEVAFQIKPGGVIEMKLEKENPLWEMKIKVEMVVLEPAGTYDCTFSLIKPGKAAQKGAIDKLPNGVRHNVGTYKVYDGINTLELTGKYTGSSTATEGKIMIYANTLD